MSMVKFLLTTLFISLISVASFGQCQPDPQYTQDGIYPDPSTLNTAILVNEPFEQILTINAPAETTIVATLNIDSVIIENILNLPPGIGVTCNPNDCKWLGGQSGCVNISGTPIQTGVFDVDIETLIYVQGLAQGFPVTESFTVEVKNSLSIQEQTLLNETRIFPNPVSNETKILFESASAGQVQIEVVDLIGNVVLQQNNTTTTGTNSLTLAVSNLAEGQYFVRIQKQNAMVVKKMLVVR